MIYDTILRGSAETDLEFFYEMRGSRDIGKIIGELNDLYKFEKDQWINKRGVSKSE
jgi:hypothetical protein